MDNEGGVKRREPSAVRKVVVTQPRRKSFGTPSVTRRLPLRKKPLSSTVIEARGYVLHKDAQWNKENVPPGVSKDPQLVSSCGSSVSLQLGGALGERHDKVARLEALTRRMEREVRTARAEMERFKRSRQRELAEAAAWKASESEREAQLVASNDETARAMARATLAEDRLGMTSSDLDALSASKAEAASDRIAAIEAASAAQASLARCKARLEHSDAENLRLKESRISLQATVGRLQKQVQGESRAKDLLLHSKTQKEKQLSTVIKEKDRLREKLLARDAAVITPTTPVQPAFTTPVVPTSTLEVQAASIRALRSKLDKQDELLLCKSRDLDKAKRQCHNLAVRLANLKGQLSAKAHAAP